MSSATRSFLAPQFSLSLSPRPSLNRQRKLLVPFFYVQLHTRGNTKFEYLYHYSPIPLDNIILRDIVSPAATSSLNSLNSFSLLFSDTEKEISKIRQHKIARGMGWDAMGAISVKPPVLSLTECVEYILYYYHNLRKWTKGIVFSHLRANAREI